MKRRVEGRNQAKAILELVSLDHVDKIEAFLDELRSTLQPAEVLKEVVASQRKLSELSAITLKYGQHAGERLEDIPRDYLEWMIRDGEETFETVRDYLAATQHLNGG